MAPGDILGAFLFNKSRTNADTTQTDADQFPRKSAFSRRKSAKIKP